MCLDCSGPRTIARSAAGRSGGNHSPSVARTPALPTPVSVADDLAIYPRSAWAGDDRPARGELYPEQVRFLLVHHTAGPSDYTEDGAIAEMQGVYAFHTGAQRGWPDVCYNFFIDRFGRVFEARTGSLDGPVVADATGGSQGFAQLVCLLGDFTAALPSPEAIAATTRTLAWLAHRHQLETGTDALTTFVSRGSNRWPEGTDVTTNTIAGHRDMSETACPGDAFYPYVTSTLRSDVASLTPSIASSPSSSRSTSPDNSSPDNSSGDGAGSSSPATAPATPPMAAATSVPERVSVASATSAPSSVASNAGPGPNLLLGGAATVGIAGIATGLVWVLKRRMENQPPAE